MSKVSSIGMTTTFELGSSDMHRVPSKPWAPSQGLIPLDGGFAREKMIRTQDAIPREYHPPRLQPGHGGISQWDHASPKLRATLGNMSSYDELERQLKYHKRGRVEKRMLKGLLLQYGCHLDAEDAHPPGLSYQYYVIKDERSGVRGYLLIQLQDAGVLSGGGSLAPRDEWDLLGFFWLDAIEGNESALREETEKLRRRKAREERLAAEAIAARLQAERYQAAEAQEYARRAKEVEKEFRRQELQGKTKLVQRRMLTQIQNRGTTSIYSLQQTFASMDLDKSYSLDRSELLDGMLKQGLELSADDVDQLINVYDQDGQGNLNYVELVEALKSELNERRYGLVLKAFSRLDTAGSGTVSVDAIAQCYRPREHPDVKARRRTEADVLREFLEGFKGAEQTGGAVSLEQFEAYFLTHSSKIEDDEYFVAMMRHAWGVVED